MWYFGTWNEVLQKSNKNIINFHENRLHFWEHLFNENCLSISKLITKNKWIEYFQYSVFIWSPAEMNEIGRHVYRAKELVSVNYTADKRHCVLYNHAQWLKIAYAQYTLHQHHNYHLLLFRTTKRSISTTNLIAFHFLLTQSLITFAKPKIMNITECHFDRISYKIQISVRCLAFVERVSEN